MKEHYINVIPGKPIMLGYEGESGVCKVIFQIPSHTADYEKTLYLLKPGTSEAVQIPANRIQIDGDSLIWTVTDDDTDKAGKGSCQIRFTRGRQTVKSPVYHTLVLPSIDDD